MGRGGGMHKMGRYAYSLVDAVAANKTFLMWMKLKEGYDPNGSYVGVTALQVALEHDPPNHEMVLILLKFGADPDKNTASRARGVRYDSGETPRMMCKRGIKENEKNPEKLELFTRMLSWMESTEARDKASEELMPRMKQLEEDERKAGQTLAEQIFTILLLIFGTVILIHLILYFLPEIAAKVYPEALTAHLCLFSPAFMGHRATFLL